MTCDLGRIGPFFTLSPHLLLKSLTEQGTSNVAQQPSPSPAQRRTSLASTTSLPPSRASTPPTDVTPPPSPPFVLPPPTAEQLRRRAQSDMASREIGAKMLRGYAMLGEECPNDTCHGIPLVRPPKPGGRDARKVRGVHWGTMSSLMLVAPLQECVVCGNIYVGGDEASTALGSPSGAQTSKARQATSARKVDKGKNLIDSSFQVRKSIGCSIMTLLIQSMAGWA